jgi:hypothetical protein
MRPSSRARVNPARSTMIPRPTLISTPDRCDDNEVRLLHQFAQACDWPDIIDNARDAADLRIDGAERHAECRRPPADFRANTARADDSHAAVRQVSMGTIGAADATGTDAHVQVHVIADRTPDSLVLPPDVGVQMSRETQDVAEDVIGDHIGEDAAHVADLARMRNELGKQIVFQAGSGRLNPFEPGGASEQRRRDFSKEAGDVGDFLEGDLFIAGIDDLQLGGDRPQRRKPLVVNGRMHEKLAHCWWSVRLAERARWR